MFTLHILLLNKIKFKSISLHLTLLLLLFFQAFKALSQNAVEGEWLVKFAAGANPQTLAGRLDKYLMDLELSNNRNLQRWSKPKAAQTPIKQVSTSLNIWTLKAKYPASVMLPWLRSQPEVLLAQQDFYVTQRSSLLPNDPYFQDQWQYSNLGAAGGTPNADLDAETAWGISTGGLTVAGDTIVIAVVDGGVQAEHPDLKQNLWHNLGEIPNDGLDNDLNGFVDDFKGWNTFLQNDNIQGLGTTHGTPVCGVIGASGDNNTGVAGVNWNVKIMFVAGGNQLSFLLAAFDYVLQARQRYNDSNGAEGAFVVALNCSWGIDFGQPADAPLWCAALNTLGEAGILSVAAAANNNVDIDQVGDLPCNCPSNYLVAVTSLDNADKKAPDAAWGAVNVDLGAYGENIFTTSSASNYGTHAGTSFAAPHVAGAVGLLYAAPCPDLIALAKDAPAQAALKAKNTILNHVTPNSDMASKTSTNGRLNLGQLMEASQSECTPCPSPFGLYVSDVFNGTAQLHWVVPPGMHDVKLKWRLASSSNWVEVHVSENSLQLDSLLFCAPYEFKLQGICPNGEPSAWSHPCNFLSNGCCSLAGLSLNVAATDHAAIVNWTNLPDFQEFRVQWRESGSIIWNVSSASNASVFIPNLKSCTVYEFQLEGWCVDTWTPIGNAGTFLTEGCGSCLDKPYCPAMANHALEEWIESVQIGDWINVSGSGGGGYQDYSAILATNPIIHPQSFENLIITPGFWGSAYKEYFRVYIDFNQDGDFDDNNEIAFDSGFALEGVASGALVSPTFNGTGSTRMRVMMRFDQDGQSPPEACGDFEFGQVEDYCVELAEALTDSKTSTDSAQKLRIFPQPASDWAWIALDAIKTQPFEITVWDVSGKMAQHEILYASRNGALFLELSGWPQGVYFVSVKSDGFMGWGKLLKQ